MLRRCLAALLLAGLAACANTPDIRVDQDRTANFAQFRTFGWASPLGTDRSGYTTLTTERLKTAVEREMLARGYLPSATPDLLVNFHARLQERTRVDTLPGTTVFVPGGYYGYRGYGAWAGYGFGAQTIVDQYTEGTVNVDLVDRARNALVWEGVAVAPVTAQDRRNPAERLDEVVAAIFARYPYRAGVGTPSPAPR